MIIGFALTTALLTSTLWLVSVKTISAFSLTELLSVAEANVVLAKNIANTNDKIKTNFFITNKILVAYFQIINFIFGRCFGVNSDRFCGNHSKTSNSFYFSQFNSQLSE